jgi:hypothetical protein
MPHLEHIPARKVRTRHVPEKNIYTHPLFQVQAKYLESVDEALFGDRVVTLGAVAMVTKPE